MTTGATVTDGNAFRDRSADQTSSTLLARVQAQEPDAWHRLVQLYGPLVYRWCRQGGFQEADAADVGQDVFQAVFKAIGSFQHHQQGASFRGWLRTIVRNKIRDFIRRKRPGGDGVGGSDAEAKLLELADSAGNEPENPAGPSDEHVLFRRAVDLVLLEFAEETRQAFLRVVVEEQEPAAVAEALGISVNAVYLAKSRVKRRIRQEFQGLL